MYQYWYRTTSTQADFYSPPHRMTMQPSGYRAFCRKILTSIARKKTKKAELYDVLRKKNISATNPPAILKQLQ
jgi:hypothetical protein